MKPVDTSHSLFWRSVIFSHPFLGVPCAAFPVSFPIKILYKSGNTVQLIVRYNDFILTWLIKKGTFINMFILFFTNVYDVECMITPLDINSKSCYLHFCTIIYIFVCLLQVTLMMVTGVTETCWWRIIICDWIKVKVKFTIEQTTKAHRRRKSVVVLFL